ncbi:MAG: phage tail terminator family protein [Fusobacteriaceae bacterium]
MKVSDVRKHLSKLLADKTGLRIYTEDIEKVARPCIYLNMISSSKESLAHYREKRKLSFDIVYIPSEKITSCNNETQDMMETINLAFENYGCRNLKVNDRNLSLFNVSENITDKAGHYVFDVEFIQQYGQEKEYELMQELELEI